MITAANLKTRSSKDLAALAKKKGVTGWQGMKKDQLVKAIVKAEGARSNTTKPSAPATPKKKAAAKAPAKAAPSKTASKPATKPASKPSRVAEPPSRSASAAKPAAKVVPKPHAAVSKPAAASSKPAAVAAKASPVVAKAAAVSSKPSSVPAKSNGVAAKSSVVASKPVITAKPNGTAAKVAPPVAKPAATKAAPLKSAAPEAKATIAPKAKPPEPVSTTSKKVIRKIQEAHELRGRRRDVATESREPGTKIAKDRCALLVRDPYWLQAYWEISRETVERAKVALSAHWHTAQPVLRLSEIDDVSTTTTAERVVREIPVHGGVCNWYIDVVDPPKTYRVALGYRTGNGKFHVLARSNKVSTPPPGAADMVDGNWSDIAENCEKIFALSGGYQPDNSDQQLKELFEERLRRPMGSPASTQYGAGADVAIGRLRSFEFTVDAEMIVFGQTDATAYVTLGGEPVKLRSDGSFAVRLPLPDRRQVLPIVASSADGVEQRTTVLAVERNTKVMEPLIRENGED